MKTLHGYLKREWRLWTLALLMTLLWALLTHLYGLPGEATVYGAAITAAVTALLLAGGYFRYAARVRQAERLSACLQDDAPPLPPPGDLLEETWQKQVLALCADRAARLSAQEARYRDLCDYYTLWAHQVKTPISALRLLSQAPQSARPGEMDAELTRVEQYVDMALSYLRLRAESHDLTFRRQSIAPIVRGAVKRLRHLFLLGQLAIVLEVEETTVLTDAKWLGFILEQLLTNAIKYTPPKGKVTVRFNGQTLTVQDTGIGIRPEDLPRVGEKGFTGANGREQQRATGLGLYLCREACGKLGIALELTSEVGKGTCVTLRFLPHETMYE